MGDCPLTAKLCECGCGNPAPISNATRRGYKNGEPQRYIHGHRKGTTHGQSGTPTYRVWAGMMSRCRDRGNTSYERYGGRGIAVCARWQGRDGFRNFLADMGSRPPGKTLDRIDNDGNYEPGNCRWSTPAEQRANQRQRGPLSEEARANIGAAVRNRPRATHCKRGHAFTDANTYVTKAGTRRCRACQEMHRQAYKARKSEGR